MCQFSNFYETERYIFSIPDEFFCRETKDLPKNIEVRFGEACIMACKALLMKDKDSFYSILEAKTPGEAKKQGRGVKNFSQQVWDANIKRVAYETVLQKFSKVRGLKDTLLATGRDSLIAECTAKDKIWGIGLDVGDPRAQDPAQWKGQNILGEALMLARANILASE